MRVPGTSSSSTPARWTPVRSKILWSGRVRWWPPTRSPPSPISTGPSALWRGPAFADLVEFEEMEWAVAAAARLDELRLGAHELRFDVMLDLGRHAQMVPELEAAVQRAPAARAIDRPAGARAVPERSAGRRTASRRPHPSSAARRARARPVARPRHASKSAILGHETWLSAPAASQRRRVPAHGHAASPAGRQPTSPPVHRLWRCRPVVDAPGERPFVGRDDALVELARPRGPTRSTVVVEWS